MFWFGFVGVVASTVVLVRDNVELGFAGYLEVKQIVEWTPHRKRWVGTPCHHASRRACECARVCVRSQSQCMTNAGTGLLPVGVHDLNMAFDNNWGDGCTVFDTCDNSVHEKGLAQLQAWHAGDVCPPGRSRRSNSRAAAPVLCVRAHTLRAYIRHPYIIASVIRTGAATSMARRRRKRLARAEGRSYLSCSPPPRPGYDLASLYCYVW